MNMTPQAMAREAAATGFGAELLEKVFRLMALLDALNSHPFLKTRIALKGGTALNLFHFDVPRLSVDIDLNYIGAVDRDTMLAEKPKAEQAVQAVCSRPEPPRADGREAGCAPGAQREPRRLRCARAPRHPRTRPRQAPARLRRLRRPQSQGLENGLARGRDG